METANFFVDNFLNIFISQVLYKNMFPSSLSGNVFFLSWNEILFKLPQCSFCVEQ